MRLTPYLLLLVGCSQIPSAGDRAFSSGHLQQAAEHYRGEIRSGELRPQQEAQATYRLALLCLRPEIAACAPQDGESLLAELAADKRHGALGQQSSLILAAHRENRKLKREAEQRQRQVVELEQQLARTQSRSLQDAGALNDRARRVNTLSGQIAALQEQIQQLTEEVDRRAQELEALKEIDLEAPP